MKTFNEFLIESSFNSKDFFKVGKDGQRKYVTRVVKDIVDNGVVYLGDKEAEEKIAVPADVRKQFEEVIGNEDDLTIEQFDELLKDVKHKNSRGKDEPIHWTLIFKGQYSLTGGGQDAKYAEAATAYCYNAMNGNADVKKSSIKGESENDDAAIIATTQILKDKGIDDRWIKSSQLTAKKIQQMAPTSTKYIAAHVDGNDISEIPDNVKTACKVFLGKEGIKEVFGSLVANDAVDSLYPSTQKDMWNKADIALIDEKLDIVKMLHEWLTANSLSRLETKSDINTFINTLIAGKQYDASLKSNKHHIIPISLKGIVVRKNTTLNDIAFEADGKLSSPKDLADIHSVKIEFPSEVKDAENKKYNASCYLRTNNGLQLTFRNKEPTKESLLIEIQLKGARGGNGLGLLKSKLNLGNGFYKSVLKDLNITAEDQYVKALESLIGQKLSVPDSLRQSTAKSVNNWFQRPAYKGLLCFLLKYREQIQHKSNGDVDLVNMFKLIYRCASGADSDSIYWLIKMK